MKITNKVKVGGYTYAVERPNDPFVANTTDVCDGLHIFSEQIILHKSVKHIILKYICPLFK